MVGAAAGFVFDGGGEGGDARVADGAGAAEGAGADGGECGEEGVRVCAGWGAGEGG